jgi:hypothetical protein
MPEFFFYLDYFGFVLGKCLEFGVLRIHMKHWSLCYNVIFAEDIFLFFFF